MKGRSATPPNMGLMGQGLSGPGAEYITLATLTDDAFVEDDSYWAPIVTTRGVPLTARVGSLYGGPEFGAFYELFKDDEVVVLFPDGSHELAVIPPMGLWGGGTPPPTRLVSDEEDAPAPRELFFLLKEGRTFRVETQGDADVIFISGRDTSVTTKRHLTATATEGDVTITATAGNATLAAKQGGDKTVKLKGANAVVDASSIKLGASATLKVARATDPVQVTIPAGATIAFTFPPPVGAVTGTVVNPVVCDGTITDGSEDVKAA